jgi:CBS domain-containing protein
LSNRDAGGRLGAAVRMNSRVADLMTAPAVTVEPATTVRQAANVMRGRSIGCLVVVEGRRVIGIVTVSDLLELVGRGLDRGAVTSKRWTLSHRAPHRKVKGGPVRAW